MHKNISFIIIFITLMIVQGCSESRERAKNETTKKKERTQQILINQKIEKQNKLNEKIYLTACKCGVDPAEAMAILNEYLLETRDFDLYDLNSDFFHKTLTSHPKPIDYKSLIDRISMQHSIPQQTTAALILEYKALSRLEDISSNVATSQGYTE